MNASGGKRAIIGILLVIVGAIFLLDNLGFDIDIPRHFFRWPMIFVIIGLVNLLSRNLRTGFIFLAMGGIFYLQYFNLVDLRTFWPAILIIIGLSFIFRKKYTSPSISKTDDMDFFDEVVIFGGTEKKYTSQKLQGGKLSAVFGGSEIDLRDCTPQDGAVIEVFCMFGGVEIFVPQDWKVNLNTTAIFGGFSDSRGKMIDHPTATVHIKGFVMFGGGEIKN